MNIYLIGARASGKTSLAKEMSRKYLIKAIDLDDIFKIEMKSEIDQYVKNFGWKKFRAEESRILQITTQRQQEDNVVYATGGGIVLAEKNRHYMRKHGLVLYLDVPEEILILRLKLDPKEKQRPFLTSMTLEEEVHAVLAQRRPLYQECSHYILDGTQPLAWLAQSIFLKVNE